MITYSTIEQRQLYKLSTYTKIAKFKKADVKRESAASHLLREWVLNIQYGSMKKVELNRILSKTKSAISS